MKDVTTSLFRKTANSKNPAEAGLMGMGGKY